MLLPQKWTTTMRYQDYNTWPKSYLNQLKMKVTQAPFRFNYHIQPQTGLLNDPNGFSFFKGYWHLFYQAYPFGPVHGVKSWHHLKSKDLIHWLDEGLAILPDSQFDSHGVYSGSALPVGDKLILSYTGNVRDENWQRHSYQMLAKMDENGKITKDQTPFIKTPPEGFTEEFRDPQLIKKENKYYTFIGGQTKNEKGKIMLYESDDLSSFKFKTTIDLGIEDLGFMMECPNYLPIENKHLFIFCPQGLDKKVCSYDNIYPNTYLMGDDFSFKNGKLTSSDELKNLDEGFDLYATQGFVAPDGRVLTVGWVGLPEIDYPNMKDGWAHGLSLIKELKIKDQQLLQQPVEEMKELRQEQTVFEITENKNFQLQPKNNTYELKLQFSEVGTGTLLLMKNDKKNTGLEVSFDTIHGKMSINRGNVGLSFAEKFGVEREFSIAKKPLTLQIFVDESMVEIFVHDGEKVATCRVFPDKTDTTISLTHSNGKVQGSFWSLKKIKQIPRFPSPILMEKFKEVFGH